MNSLNRKARWSLRALPILMAIATHAAAGAADTSSKNAAVRSQPDSVGQGNPLDFFQIDRLPPRYAGSECVAVGRKLKSFNVTKSEFETSAAYGARVAALASRRIDGARTMADPIAFVDAGSVIESKYVADAGHLDVTAKWDRITQRIEGSSHPGVIVSYRLEGERKVMMSNAFGSSVQGTEALWSVCALAFKNVEDAGYGQDTISALIPMTPSEAKAAKPQLALMVIGTLAPPFVGTYDDHHNATLDDPREVGWHGDALVLNLLEVWLYNRATGKIYKKVPMPGQGSARAASVPATADAAARPPMPATMAHGRSVELDGCKPTYPARSKRLEETGTTTVSFWVSPEGRVIDSKIVRSTGFRSLDLAAKEGLSKCTFHPAVEHGVPVNTWVDVRYTFSLD